MRDNNNIKQLKQWLIDIVTNMRQINQSAAWARAPIMSIQVHLLYYQITTVKERHIEAKPKHNWWIWHYHEQEHLMNQKKKMMEGGINIYIWLSFSVVQDPTGSARAGVSCQYQGYKRGLRLSCNVSVSLVSTETEHHSAKSRAVTNLQLHNTGQDLSLSSITKVLDKYMKWTSYTLNEEYHLFFQTHRLIA